MSVAKKNTKTDAGAKGAKAGRSGGRAKSSPQKPDEMSSEVMEFIQAIDEYKRLQQRPFPSWSEVLEVIKGLGYSKVD